MANNYKINNKANYTESNECLIRGVCYANSTLTSLQEVILVYLKGLSFYLLKLKELGITDESIKKTIIYSFFNIITNAEYNQEQFQEIIETLYDSILKFKSLYEKICLEKEIAVESLKTYFKYSKNFNLTNAIRKGEKYFIKKSQSCTPKQKDLYDIVLFLSKSIGIKMVELKRLGKSHDDAYYALLYLLNAPNPSDFSEEKAKLIVEKTIDIYHDVAEKVFLTQNELYGETSQTEVSFSSEPGKAIMVSGSDFKQLEMVLRAAENTKIKVYTHGTEMLMAHAFPKLRNHPNLKGHFGSGLESSLIDFATFPGAILMTKASLHRVEYLYRGRLYTLDPIAPSGVINIKGNDFKPLVKSALEAKGFSKAHQKPFMKVGFDKKEIDKKINEIVNKLKKKEIRHLYIIGLLNTPNPMSKQYFDKFFELLPKDCYAISLSHPIVKENAFHFDSFCNYSLICKILHDLDKTFSLKELDMSIFLTRCNKHTITNLLNLKHAGIKNVYVCKCPPTLINPSLMETLQETFGAKEISEPQKDIEDTLAK